MIPEEIDKIVSNNAGPLSLEELEMGESVQALEYAIYNELHECLLEIENNTKTDPQLNRITAELQCALDIVQSAQTIDERKKVYDILMSLGKFPQ